MTKREKKCVANGPLLYKTFLSAFLPQQETVLFYRRNKGSTVCHRTCTCYFYHKQDCTILQVCDKRIHNHIAQFTMYHVVCVRLFFLLCVFCPLLSRSLRLQKSWLFQSLFTGYHILLVLCHNEKKTLILTSRDLWPLRVWLLGSKGQAYY